MISRDWKCVGRHPARSWRKMSVLLPALLSGAILSTAQSSFPVNGVADPRSGCYAFVNATLVKDAHTRLPNATLIIRDGLIVAAGKGLTPPHGRGDRRLQRQERSILPLSISIATTGYP